MEYAANNSSASDRLEVLVCTQYLCALNDIFERTLLGKKTRFFSPSGTGMQHLDDGFAFFKQWCEELRSSGEFDSGVDSKHFLSWQVCVYNYVVLCVQIYGILDPVFNIIIIVFTCRHGIFYV